MIVPFFRAGVICEGSGGHVSPYVRRHPVFRIRIQEGKNDPQK
jgi:hypothetical protein